MPHTAAQAAAQAPSPDAASADESQAQHGACHVVFMLSLLARSPARRNPQPCSPGSGHPQAAAQACWPETTAACTC
eukprot:365900-Chlamydomonas_euryale.AAC.11